MRFWNSCLEFTKTVNNNSNLYIQAYFIWKSRVKGALCWPSRALLTNATFSISINKPGPVA